LIDRSWDYFQHTQGHSKCHSKVICKFEEDEACNEYLVDGSDTERYSGIFEYTVLEGYGPIHGPITDLLEAVSKCSGEALLKKPKPKVR